MALDHHGGWSGHLSIPFELVVALGGWTAVFLLLVLTKGRLGYVRTLTRPNVSR